MAERITPERDEWSEQSRELLAAAEAGDSDALGRLLDGYRGYLVSIAREEMAGQYAGKVNPSDAVQDTFLEACRAFSRFSGEQSDELRKWLRGILLNKLRNLHDHYFATQKRQAEREQSINDSVNGPILREELSANATTPSGELSLREENAKIHQTLARLPEEYRLVLQLRNWDSLSFAEIGQRLQRSEDAARMLFVRALNRFQEELGSAYESATSDE